MNLGERIRAARKHAGLNQTQLAKLVGVSQQMITKIETGKADATSALLDICVETGVSPRWLARFDGPMVASHPVSLAPEMIRSAIELARRGMAKLGVDTFDPEEPEAAIVVSFAIDYLADDSSPALTDSVVLDFMTALEKRNAERRKTGSLGDGNGEPGRKETRTEGVAAGSRRRKSKA